MTAKSRWTPNDIKAIKWWAEENNAKQLVPFARPKVSFELPDGTKVTKPVYHVRDAWEKWRTASKRTDKKKEGA